jgi:hypothetical protein
LCVKVKERALTLWAEEAGYTGRHTVVMLKNGNAYVGLLQEEDEKQVRIATGANPDDVVVLEKTQIVSRESSALGAATDHTARAVKICCRVGGLGIHS